MKRTITDRKALDLISALLQDQPVWFCRICQAEYDHPGVCVNTVERDGLLTACGGEAVSDMLDRIRSLVGGTARIATPYTRPTDAPPAAKENR